MSIIIRNVVYFYLWSMWLNSYQETILHDRHVNHWWESSVFRVDRSDGRQECIKEYSPHIQYANIKYYHDLHNVLAQYPFEFPTDFVLHDQPIKKIRYEVLALGQNIVRVMSLEDKEEICITTVPYVGGIPLEEIFDGEIHYPNNEVVIPFFQTRDKFVKAVAKVVPIVSNSFKLQLCECNMKCFLEGDIMRIVITDLCGAIHRFYSLCDITKLSLIQSLQS